MDYSGFEYLDIEVRGYIATVTLNGPERGNAPGSPAADGRRHA